MRARPAIYSILRLHSLRKNISQDANKCYDKNAAAAQHSSLIVTQRAKRKTARFARVTAHLRPITADMRPGVAIGLDYLWNQTFSADANRITDKAGIRIAAGMTASNAAPISVPKIDPTTIRNKNALLRRKTLKL